MVVSSLPISCSVFKISSGVVKHVSFTVRKTNADPVTLYLVNKRLTKGLTLSWFQSVSLLNGDVFIHSFNKYLMSFYYAPGPVPGAGNVAVSRKSCSNIYRKKIH